MRNVLVATISLTFVVSTFIDATSCPVFNLSEKVVVVTGANGDIGSAICALCEQLGATVVTTGLFDTEYILDVSDPTQVHDVIEAIIQKYGRIDVFINNAGVAYHKSTLELTDEEWHKIMRVNLDGVFYCTREVARHMKQRGSGCIVNLGSMPGIIVNKPQAQSAYNASKAAVHMFTKSLACELAPCGIRVNAVTLGYVETAMTLSGRENEEYNCYWIEMTPMARYAQPKEIASCVAFLASDMASFCTGTILTVDGGYTSW